MPDSTQPTDFYSSKTLYSLAGGTTATWIITNFYLKLLPAEPLPSILIALIVAQIVSIAGYVTLTKVQKKFSGYFIAVINGFLIASSALGFNTANSSVGNDSAEKASATNKTSFIPIFDNTSWLPPARLVNEIQQKSDSIIVIKDTLSKTNSKLIVSKKENDILYRTIIPENSAAPIIPIREDTVSGKTPIDKLTLKLVNAKLESRALEQQSRMIREPEQKRIINQKIEEKAVEQRTFEFQIQKRLETVNTQTQQIQRQSRVIRDQR